MSLVALDGKPPGLAKGRTTWVRGLPGEDRLERDAVTHLCIAHARARVGGRRVSGWSVCMMQSAADYGFVVSPERGKRQRTAVRSDASRVLLRANVFPYTRVHRVLCTAGRLNALCLTAAAGVSWPTPKGLRGTSRHTATQGRQPSGGWPRGWTKTAWRPTLAPASRCIPVLSSDVLGTATRSATTDPLPHQRLKHGARLATSIRPVDFSGETYRRDVCSY